MYLRKQNHEQGLLRAIFYSTFFVGDTVNSPSIPSRLFQSYATYAQWSQQSRTQRINLCLSSGLLAFRVAPEGIAWSFQSGLVIIYRLAVHLLHHVAITAVSEWQLTRPVPAYSSGTGKQRPRPICTRPVPTNTHINIKKMKRLKESWSIIDVQAPLTLTTIISLNKNVHADICWQGIGLLLGLKLPTAVTDDRANDAKTFVPNKTRCPTCCH